MRLSQNVSIATLQIDDVFIPATSKRSATSNFPRLPLMAWDTSSWLVKVKEDTIPKSISETSVWLTRLSSDRHTWICLGLSSVFLNSSTISAFHFWHSRSTRGTTMSTSMWCPRTLPHPDCWDKLSSHSDALDSGPFWSLMSRPILPTNSSYFCFKKEMLVVCQLFFKIPTFLMRTKIPTYFDARQITIQKYWRNLEVYC